MDSLRKDSEAENQEERFEEEEELGGVDVDEYDTGIAMKVAINDEVQEEVEEERENSVGTLEL